MTWSHTPRLPILIWCLWVFPFTLWDTIYLVLRPYSLPSNKWHHPYFSGTFTIWASIDHIYGQEGYDEKEGFVLAQSVMNMLEAILCIVYAWYIWTNSTTGFWSATVTGKKGARAVLVGLSAGYVTAIKTALYFLREVFSGYKYTGHNEWKPFLVTWYGMKCVALPRDLTMLIVLAYFTPPRHYT
ncbi:hypothetical protein DM02DRAFT_651326 [Periconia macrospinosa]|uniref:Uncharacterized protein n=1 Tax=Periconia macrospinosa TaxID=97972 RepID=A0A2V1E416_9PLEO|nr:hypothetical protein DM02DRAFT_651326 [Periconia macrospinosa]